MQTVFAALFGVALPSGEPAVKPLVNTRSPRSLARSLVDLLFASLSIDHPDE
jgi:hypothetical protein